LLGVDVASDDRDPLRFHALPPPPTLTSQNGRPDLELLRFVSNGELTGGHLRIGTQLAHPPGRLDEVRTALAAELRDDAVAVSPAAVTAATAQMEFIGREPDGRGGTTGLVARSYGAAPARVDHPHVALLAIGLTPDGVRLVDAALRSGAAPIGIICRVSFEGWWPAQRIVAHVDWNRVYEHVSAHFRTGNFLTVEDVTRLVEELREERAIRLDVVKSLASDGEPADSTAALSWVQREVVERFCVPVIELDRRPAAVSLGTVGELLGVGTRFAAKQLTQIERATADVDFQRGVVLGRTLTRQANLADVVVGLDPTACIIDAGTDHPFFARFWLHMRPSVPLESIHVSEVVVDAAYGSAQMGARLVPEAPEATVETWADASPDRTWTIQASVTFTLDAPVDPGARVSLAPFRGDTREVTLDVENMLGLRRFDVSAVPDERVAATRATLRRMSGTELRDARELILSAAVPASVAWFRGRQPGDRFELSVEHILSDGRIVRHAPVPVESSVVRVPPAYVDALTVQLVSEQDWGEVERIAVALQRVGSDRTGTVVLDQPGASAVVNLDLPDPVDRRFRYRTSRMLRGGILDEDDWMETDVPVVLVGRTAANLLAVELTPVGSELSTAGVLLIEVELLYVDAVNQIRASDTKVVRALADRPRWDVVLADPTQRTYEYRITVHRTSGSSLVGPWTKSTDRILVVPITA
jgi:hypothetical protein